MEIDALPLKDGGDEPTGDATTSQCAVLLSPCHPIAHETMYKEHNSCGTSTLVVLSCGGLLMRLSLPSESASRVHRVVVRPRSTAVEGG